LLSRSAPGSALLTRIPSTTLCQLVDTTEKNCEMFARAGECERFGTAAGRDHCAGWTPDQVETPSQS